MDGSPSTNCRNVPLFDPPPISTSPILPSSTADHSSDEKYLQQATDGTSQSIPAIKRSNEQEISLTVEKPYHASGDSRQNNLTSEGGRALTLYQSGPTEQTPIDGVEMPTRTPPERLSGLDRMELPSSFTPPRTETKPHVHPFKKSINFLWKVLVLPFRIIISLSKFLVMLLCIIMSIVWAIPCIILYVVWSTAVFITAGDRCDPDDDEDDAFDTFRCWGVIPCCGIGFFFVLAILGFKSIWSLGMVVVNPDNTSGLNNWLATSIHDMLDSLF